MWIFIRDNSFWMLFFSLLFVYIAILLSKWAFPLFRMPRMGLHVSMTCVLILVIEFLCVPTSPLYKVLPEDLRFQPLWGPNGHVHLFGLTLCVAWVIPFFRLVNHQRLSELKQFKLSTSDNSRHFGTEKGRALAAKLSMIVEHLSGVAVSVPFFSNFVLRFREVHHLRQEVFRLLTVSCERTDLDFILLRTNLPRLFVAAANADTLMLLRKQTPNLAVETKAAIIDALQKSGGLRKSAERQEWVMEAFLSTFGGDLTLLKNIMDGGGDYHSLHKLVYKDLRTLSFRTAVLDHIERQSNFQDPEGCVSSLMAGISFATNDTNCNMPRQRSVGMVGVETEAIVKVLSDIDDTLYCSGGHFPAGVDRRYPRFSLYPGILHIFMELDNQWRAAKSIPKSFWKTYHAGKEREEGIDKYLCNLVFLSARPHTHKDLSESVSYKLFNRLYVEGRLHAMPTLLPGSLANSTSAVLRAVFRSPRAWKNVGEEKYRKLCNYKALYPECEVVFFGDNGQGDVITAELAMGVGSPSGDRAIRAAFIHEVLPREETCTILTRHTQEEREAEWARLDIFFARTPVMSATNAARVGLLKAESLHRICCAAVDELEALAICSPSFPGWVDRAKELNEDLEIAGSFLFSQSVGGLCWDWPLPYLDVEALREELLDLVLPPNRNVSMSHSNADDDSVVESSKRSLLIQDRDSISSRIGTMRSDSFRNALPSFPDSEELREPSKSTQSLETTLTMQRFIIA